MVELGWRWEDLERAWQILLTIGNWVNSKFVG
jgi:hypothetical protein